MKSIIHLKRLILLVLTGCGILPAALAANYVDAPVDGTEYRIVNAKGTERSLYDDGGTDAKPKQTGFPTLEIDENRFYWIVKSHADGGYSICNKVTGRYLQGVATSTGSASLSTTETICYIEPNSAGEDVPYFNILASAGSTISLNIDGSNGTIIGYEKNDGKGELSASEWGFAPYEPELIGAFRFYGPRNGNHVLAESDGKMVMATTDEADYSRIWMLERSGNTFLMRNASTGHFLSEDPADYAEQGTSTAAHKVYIKTVNGDNTKVIISHKADFSGHTCLHEDGGNKVVTWDADGANSHWKYEKVTNIPHATLANHLKSLSTQYAATVESGKYYRLVNYMHHNAIGETAVSKELTMRALNDTEYTQYWQLNANADGTAFSLKNAVSGQYIQATPGNGQKMTSGATEVFFPITPNAAFPYDNLHNIGSDDQFLHADSHGFLTTWGICTGIGSNEASLWYVESTDITAEEFAAAAEQQEAAELLLANADRYCALFANFYTDATCRELKDTYAAMSADELKAAMAAAGLPAFFRTTAADIQGHDSRSKWEKEFRVADFGAYSRPEYWAGKLKTKKYSRLNNPTGILLAQREPLLIMVGHHTLPEGATLTAELLAGNAQEVSATQSIELKTGPNLIVADEAQSHLFIQYTSPDGALIADCPPISIHFEGGTVNGWFDCRARTDADWVEMQQAGLFGADIIDVMGTYAQWRMNSRLVIENNPTQILRTMQRWDEVVKSQLNLMGLLAPPTDDEKTVAAYEDLYPKRFNNHMQASSNTSGYMDATDYRTRYNENTLSNVINYDRLKQGEVLWGPGHEIGHCNQGAIHVIKSAEVSNNLFANVVVFEDNTTTTRGWNVQKMQEAMAAGEHQWIKICKRDVFNATRMYFSLYLYYHAVGHDPLFYQKLFKLLRANPLNNPQGNVNATDDYLHFALKACEAAGEDLSDFFEYWGFFEPITNEHVDEYGTWYVTATEEEIAQARATMQAYAKKANPNLMFIEDRAEDRGLKGFDGEYTYQACTSTLGQFTDFNGERAAIDGLTYSTPDESTVRINGQDVPGLAGIKFHDADGKLIYVAANLGDIAIPESLRSRISTVELAMTDGSSIPLYDPATTTVYNLSIYHPDGTHTARYTNGSDEALLSAERDGANAVAFLAADAPEELRQLNNIVDKDGTAHRFVLTDKADFYAPQPFTASTFSYTRTSKEDSYNSFCLPVALALQDLPEGCSIENFTSTRTDNDEHIISFTSVDEVAAGTPCLVYFPQGVSGVTIEKTNAEVVTAPGSVSTGSEGAEMLGSFTSKPIGAGFYKLNNAGTHFGITGTAGKVTAFRSYLSLPAALGIKSFRFEHGTGTTGLAAPVLRAPGSTGIYYDLQGRPVTAPLKNRLYIRDGQVILNR